MKVYITKYLFTEGIQEREVRQSDSYRDMVSLYPVPGRCSMNFHGEGSEWHRTREGAVARALQLQQAKIKSLEKSIAKIKAMKFE